MTIQHRVAKADAEIVIHCCRLVDGKSKPGTIQIDWLGAGGEHSLWLEGNLADEFMEQYRAAQTEREKSKVMAAFIRQEAIV
jgi:hypothetical protein